MTDDEKQKYTLGIEQFLASDRERTTAKELYGDSWNVAASAKLGTEFKSAVENGEFPQIRALPKDQWNNQKNHVEYVKA